MRKSFTLAFALTAMALISGTAARAETPAAALLPSNVIQVTATDGSKVYVNINQYVLPPAPVAVPREKCETLLGSSYDFRAFPGGVCRFWDGIVLKVGLVVQDYEGL